MSQRASHWSLTINNPEPSDYEAIDRARQKGWRVTGQEEKGKEGTPHLQLHLATPQVRFSAVKKLFTRAHIEIARNPMALEAYVNKDDTRAGALPTAQEKYPSLSKFWQLIFLHCEERNFINWGDASIERWWKEAYYTINYPRPDEDAYVGQAQAQEFAMLVFNHAVHQLISDGYHVDQFYSPPIQNLWKKFHFAILQRSHAEIVAQTDRQTDNSSESSAEVPVMEHNHAVCPSCQEAGIPPPPPGPDSFCPHRPRRSPPPPPPGHPQL